MARLKDVTTAHVQACRLSDIAVEKVATNLSTQALPAIGPAELEAAVGEAVKKLAEELNTLSHDVGILSGTAAPTYVESTYRGQGQTHMTCDSLTCFCGFKWREQRATPVLTKAWALLSEVKRCKRCCTLAPPEIVNVA